MSEYGDTLMNCKLLEPFTVPENEGRSEGKVGFVQSAGISTICPLSLYLSGIPDEEQGGVLYCIF